MSKEYQIKFCSTFTAGHSKAWVCNTERGPVIRYWRAYHGWHHAKWVTAAAGGCWTYGEPCDPRPLQEVLHAL